jgi:hypothetical protein
VTPSPCDATAAGQYQRLRAEDADNVAAQLASIAPNAYVARRWDTFLCV